MFPLIRFNRGFVGLTPYNQDIPSNRIKTHSKFSAFFINFFSALFRFKKGTVKVQDLDKNNIHLNKLAVIDWILAHNKDAKLDKKNGKALRQMLHFICNKTPSKPPKTISIKPPPAVKSPEEIMFDKTFEAAQRKDPLAEAKLSKLYFLGIGTKQSISSAIEYAQRSSAQGNAKGQFFLASIYLNDPNFAHSSEAVSLLNQSAAQGFTKAEFILGNIYLRGKLNTPISHPKAFTLIKSAAEKKFSLAYEQLGLLYLKGIGTPVNEAEAFKWYSKAAHQQDASPASLRILGILYQDGIGVNKSSDEAFKWLVKAADKNDRSALYLTGIMHIKSGAPDSLKEAFKCFVKAKKLGDHLSEAWIGLMLFDKGDQQIGLAHLLRAWNHGDQSVKNFINKERAARNVAPEIFVAKR